MKNDILEELKIDLSKLDENAANNPILIQKYLDLYYINLNKLNETEEELNELTARKMEFYKTQYKLVPQNPTELKYLINGDKEIIELKIKFKKLNLQVNYWKDIVQQFKDRNWSIKNAIDFRKFKEGEV